MSLYDRDPTVPFWRSNVDVYRLLAAHAHRPERAEAWLRFRDVSVREAVMMRGHFELGILGDHTFSWTFTPTHTGGLAVVLPVYEQHRLVDLLAICRHDHSIWGCVSGAGQYVGTFADPLLVHDTAISWLTSNSDGVLPLAKAFFPADAVRSRHCCSRCRTRVEDRPSRFYQSGRTLRSELR